jgi:glycyl-tRNA synthetase beta subunit
MLPTEMTRALRRAALGILRILIEKKLDLDLIKTVQFAVAQFGVKIKPAGLPEQVLEFIFDRLRARYEDEGVDVSVYLSVRALQPASALDFDQRVQAVQAFRKLPEAAALAAVNKRVSNLLSKADGNIAQTVEPKYFDNAKSFAAVGDSASRSGRSADVREPSVQRSADPSCGTSRPVDVRFPRPDGSRKAPACEPTGTPCALRTALGVADISLLS